MAIDENHTMGGKGSKSEFGKVCRAQWDFTAAEKVYQESLDIIRSAVGEDNELFAQGIGVSSAPSLGSSVIRVT